jgi:hypothetical protein
MLLVVKWLLLFFLSSLCFADVIAPPLPLQDFTQNPNTIVWKQINTEHFQIIFPEEIEKEAQRVAHTLETVYPHVVRSLDKAPRKLPLVLQNQASVSNGFVTLAPWRSEWVMIPGLEPIFSNTEWLKTLAIHEFRHAVQFGRSLSGFNKFLYVILGEQGQALGANIALAPWYFEGDAVGTETALTNGGRGRLPRFEREIRAILLSGKKYEYDQAHLRSYKNFIPNHYVYGYFYTSKMREKHGDKFLTQLSDEAIDHSYNPFAIYRAYEKLTGEEFETFYENLMTEMAAKWEEKKNLIKPSPVYTYPTKEFKTWTNQEYPQPLIDGKILSLKSGLGDIQQFVVTGENGEEEIIHYPAPIMDMAPIKLRDGKFAYGEVEVDPRFGLRDYQRINIIDIEAKKVIKSWPKTKWRQPVLSHGGKSLAVVEWNEKQEQIIQVLSVESGKIEKALVFPASDVITSMDWHSADDSLFLMTKDRQDMMGIYKINIERSTIETVLNPSSVSLNGLNVYDDWVLYESPESGIDNIFALNHLTFEKKQITSSLIGAYAPQVSQGVLYYNEYSVDGMKVVRKEGAWNDHYPSSNSFVPYYEAIKNYENKGNLGEKILNNSSLFSVDDYNQKKEAFNLHSWTLLAPPLGVSIIAQGISRDILNNTSLTFGADYDLNDHTVKGFTSINWNHYYPIFDFGIAYGGRKKEVRLLNGQKTDRHWEEGTAELGVTLPWMKYSGRFLNSASVRFFDSFIKVTNKVTNDRSELSDGALHAPGISFNLSSLSRRSSRDLFPDWGASLNYHGQWANDVSGDNNQGRIQSVDSRFYLPGIMKHHSFYHQIGYEKQDDKDYRFNTRIIYPRGFENDFFKEFSKYSANYTLPLFYPDMDWDGWVFWKRIIANVYYDHLVGTPPFAGLETNYSSYGWELMFENHYLRIMYLPITLGVRQNFRVHGPKEDFSDAQVFIQAFGSY